MDATTLQTPLQARKEGGGTETMTDWYLKSETGPLRDVLLGPSDTFRWLGLENAEYSSLVRDTLRKGRVFDPKLAERQHAENGTGLRRRGDMLSFPPFRRNYALPGLCTGFFVYDALRRSHLPDGQPSPPR